MCISLWPCASFLLWKYLGVEWLNDIVVVQSLSRVYLFTTPLTAAHQAPQPSTISRNFLKFMSTESVMLSNHLILCHPLLLCLPSFPTGSFPVSRLFISGGPNIGALASASVLPVNIQGWFLLGLTDLISLQSKGLSSLLQQHNSKISLLCHSAFFMIQLSHPYMTAGKAIALIIRTFVSKLMALFFKTLSRLT